jgi:hypothetical protein
MAVSEETSFDSASMAGTIEDDLGGWAAQLAASDREAGDYGGGEPPASNRTTISDVYQSVNRVHKHDLPKQRVAARLRRLGGTVHTASAALSYDLVVGGETRVTLRVAYPGLRRHRVTVGGRSYRYRYRTWHFNFHHHGRFSERYTDFFVCIAVNPKGRDQVFVIPWEEVTGKTFSLHGGRGEYTGRYARFRDGWERVLEAAKRIRPLRRVA